MFLNPVAFWPDVFVLTIMVLPVVFFIAFFVLAIKTKVKIIKWPLYVVAICLLLISGCIVYATFIEPHRVTVTKFDIPFPTLQPLKTILIADTHLGGFQKSGHLERVVTEINKQDADIVMIAGDYIDGLQYNATLLEPLKNLKTKHGVFGIMGNHDFEFKPNQVGQTYKGQLESLLNMLEQYGVKILRQEEVILNINNQAFALAGIDDLWVANGNVNSALQNIPDGTPTILLSHNPSVVRHPAINNVDLVVAGHTHGGQIALPWLGPISGLPTNLGKQYDQGVFQWSNKTTLAITRGLGETFLRMRFWVPPEIMVLNLIPKE
jgi:predicted MPP superfamily phosphohydrolase